MHLVVVITQSVLNITNCVAKQVTIYLTGIIYNHYNFITHLLSIPFLSDLLDDSIQLGGLPHESVTSSKKLDARNTATSLYCTLLYCLDSHSSTAVCISST